MIEEKIEELADKMMKKIDKDKKFWEDLRDKLMKIAAEKLNKTEEELQKDIEDHASGKVQDENT